MKKIALLLSALSCFQITADAQGLQATLVNGPTANSIRVRVKNNTASAITGNLVSFTFALRVPDQGAANPSIVTTSLMVNPGSNAGLPAYTDAGYRYYDNFITLNGGNAVNIAAGGEMDAFSVTFTGGAGSSNVELVAKQQTGPGSAGPNNATEYYVALNTGEITDNTTRFYNNGFNSVGLTNSTAMSVVGLSGIALPVTYTHLEAAKEGSSSLLTWGTGSEKNNRGFDIERSADGKAFTAIGFIQSHATGGNSSSGLEYSYADKTPAAGMNYYRLKQISLDGKTSYSNIVRVQFDIAGGVRVYPNPANTTLTVEAAGIKSIAVYNVAGQQMSVPVQYGDLRHEVRTASLAEGIYSIRVEAAGSTTVYKVVLQH